MAAEGRKVLGREERKRLLPGRKFKESRRSQETAGLARFPERRPGLALEWRRPERHEEWGLCQLPPLRKLTDRWTDRQTGSAERDAKETCGKSQGRGRYRGRSLCAPWADPRPLLSFRFQEGRCCVSLALAEALLGGRVPFLFSTDCS